MPTVRNAYNTRAAQSARSTEKAVASQKTETVKKTGRADGFVQSSGGSNKVALVAVAKVLEPALMRTLFGAAGKMGQGDAHAIALQAMKTFAASPEMMAAFKHAQPMLLAAAETAHLGKIARAALPFAVDGKMTKALLEVGMQVGGRSGKRLVAAAIRGMKSGGLSHSAAEIAATTAKIGAKAGGKGFLATVGKGLGKALPIIGNAANILAVASSLKGLIDVLRDPNASPGDKLARVLHLATTVTGCFIPAVGVVGDVAMTAKDIAKK